MDDKLLKAQEHYERGDEFDAAGDVERAVEEWKRAVEINPNYFDAHYNLGIAYADEGDLDLAVEELEFAHTLDVGDNDARRELVRVLIERGEARNGEGNTMGAIEDWDHALELVPENALAHFYLGQAYAKQLDYLAAAEHFRAAIRSNPFYTKAYEQLADVYLADDRVQDALDVLWKALNTFDPGLSHIDIFHVDFPHSEGRPLEIDVSGLARKLAGLELKNGNPDQAMAALEHAKLGKEDAALWRRIGTALEARGDAESAELASNRAAEIERGEMGGSETAEAEIKPAAADAYAHYNLGLSYQADEKYDLAENEFREVLRIDPEDVDAHYSLGEIFDERHEWESALREYREVLRVAPDDQKAREGLIWDLLETNALVEAQTELERAEPETSTAADLWEELGRSFEERGSRGSAIESYQRALKLNKNLSDARAGLKRLGIKG